MLGTPGQKASAIRQSIQEPEDLATRVRRQQVRADATEQEQEKLDKAKQLQTLSSLEGRVDILAQQALEAGAQQQADVELQAQVEDQETQDLLLRLRDNPNDFEALKQLNTKLGRTEVADMLTAEELMGQFGGEAEQIAQAFGDTVQNELTVGNIPVEELNNMGIAGIDELAGMLNTDVATLQGMSIDGLVETINAAIAEEQASTEGLRAKLDDPRLGAAERAEARQQLRELGAVGI